LEVPPHSTRLSQSKATPALSWLFPALLNMMVLGLVLELGAGCHKSPAPAQAADVPNGPLTFNRHVAPIIFNHCSSCHRPGQSAPFSFLSFNDVKKRARQILEVIESRYMPPWLPAPGYGEFKRARVLTSAQIETIRRWIREGTIEGDPKDLPSLPVWPEGWKLGTPDLVVTMPETFTLRAEGPDIYRNFVIPIPGRGTRYVRAMEFNPGNHRIVHHAFFLLDKSGTSRERDAQEPGPGFNGIHTPPGAQTPPGHFMSWQPGKQPAPSGEGMPWVLEEDTDLVLQLHLQSSGKPEPIRSSMAFYFTDQPPRKFPLKLWLSSYDIAIPAGQSDYVLEDSYLLPGDVDVLGILPHAHYLAREMHAYATLPDGTRRWLLRINHWDFNWQGDYQYAQPVFLPQGSRLTMHFVYDNSTNNVANPSQPPKEVRYGLQSTDEMGELWLQVLPRNPAGRAAIEKDYRERVLRDSVAYNRFVLRHNPQDGRAYTDLGKALIYQGKFADAEAALTRACQVQPDLDDSHYYLGLLYRMRNKTADAFREFSRAVQLNPRHAKAHGNLGFMFLEQGNLNEAEAHLKTALDLNPKDQLARDALADVAKARNGNGKPGP
jgi:mono/diheme cytochrome c family protein